MKYNIETIEEFVARAGCLGATSIQVIALDRIGLLKDVAEWTIADWDDDLPDDIDGWILQSDALGFDLVARFEGHRFEVSLCRTEVRPGSTRSITYELDDHTRATMAMIRDAGSENSFGISVATP